MDVPCEATEIPATRTLEHSEKNRYLYKLIQTHSVLICVDIFHVTFGYIRTLLCLCTINHLVTWSDIAGIVGMGPVFFRNSAVRRGTHEDTKYQYVPIVS